MYHESVTIIDKVESEGETSNGALAPCRPGFFLNNLKATFLSFKKIGIKILDVEIVELYRCAKS
jgi:hypothetical protein